MLHYNNFIFIIILIYYYTNFKKKKIIIIYLFIYLRVQGNVHSDFYVGIRDGEKRNIILMISSLLHGKILLVK